MNISKIVYDRLEDICPAKKLVNMSDEEVKHDCKIAFLIIGYDANDISKSFNEAWKTSRATMLFEFIYDIWRSDSNENPF